MPVDKKNYIRNYSMGLRKADFYRKLVKKFFEISPIIKRELKEKGLDVNKTTDLTPPNISENCYYYISLLNHIFNIDRSFILLYQIRVFLKYPSLNDKYPEYGISKDRFIQYHCSNHSLILISIFDQLLELVNKTFRLGISPKFNTNNIILRNKWIKLNDIDTVLKDIKNNIQPLRTDSNLYRHSGQLRKLDNIFKKDKQDLEFIKIFPFGNQALVELEKDEKFMYESTLKLLSKLDEVYKKWDRIIEDNNWY